MFKFINRLLKKARKAEQAARRAEKPVSTGAAANAISRLRVPKVVRHGNPGPHNAKAPRNVKITHGRGKPFSRLLPLDFGRPTEAQRTRWSRALGHDLERNRFRIGTDNRVYVITNYNRHTGRGTWRRLSNLVGVQHG